MQLILKKTKLEVTKKQNGDMNRPLLLFFFSALCYLLVKSNNFDLHLLYNNSYTTIDKTVNISWPKYNICDDYNIEVSLEQDFNEFIYQSKVDNNNAVIQLPEYGLYFIRVKPICSKTWITSTLLALDKFSYNIFIENWFASDSNITINAGRVSRWGDYLNNINKFGIQNTVNNRPIVSSNERFINNNSTVYFRPQTTRSNLILNKRVALNNFTIIALYQFLNNNSSQSQVLLGENSNGFFVEYDSPLRGLGVLSMNNSNSPEFEYCDKLYIDTIFSINTISKNRILINNKNKPINGSITDTFRYSNIGSRVDFSDVTSFQGKVAEIIVFNKELSENEITLFHNYLYTKYAPPVNLGSDIIFGSTFSNNYTIDASNRFIKYLWSTGDTTQTINVQNCGTYSVTTTDVFGRTSTDEIQVYPYNRLNNDTLYICDGNSITIHLNSNSILNKLWSNGSTSDSIVINSEGTYVVSLTDINNKVVKDTITVLFDKLLLSNIPSNNTLNGCRLEEINVVNNTGIESILWSNNSTTNSYTITQNEEVSVYAKSYVGCEYRDTFNINIVGEKPIVDFEIGDILCEKQNVQLYDASFPPFGNSISTWEWNFSDTTGSTEQNPEKTFQSSGAKSITLKATTNVGCFDKVTKTITLNRKPRALFDNLLACAGNPTQFRDFSIPNSDSIQLWNWNFNNMGTSTQKNPLFEFPSANLYYVHLKATNTNGCFDTLTKPLGVNISPTASFTSDSIACTNSIITFNNTSSAPFPLSITAFNWFFGDGAQDNFLNNTSHTYTTNGNYTVRLAVRANNQCVDTIAKKINIYKQPVVDFDISNNKCIGQAIQFTDVSTVSGNTYMSNWTWLFGGIGTSNQQNPSFTFTEQGNYTVQLNASTNKGCSAIKVKSVTVTEPPVVDFNFLPTNGLPPLDVSFNNLSPSGSTFSWNFGDGSAIFNGPYPPIHNYNSVGNYPIQLSATNFLGCTNTVTKYILVDVANIDVELLNLAITQDEDYYRALLGIKNNSNIPIYNLELTIRLGNGTLIREIWNGVLLPNQTLNYSFVSELRYNGTSNIPVICANIESVNFNATENNISNNSSCEDFTIGDFDILALYPNPTSGQTNLGVMMPETNALQIKVYNYLGQELVNLDYNAIQGYNLIPIDLSMLHVAQYIIEARYNDKVARKTVQKK